jgi:hypothetical protein
MVEPFSRTKLAIPSCWNQTPIPSLSQQQNQLEGREMLVVGLESVASGCDRSALDSEAHQVVCAAYRDFTGHPSAKFDAALEAYMQAYPHISKEVARHAVAYILATDGL